MAIIAKAIIVAGWNLLREHLKGDRLWKKLADWEQAYLDHLAAGIAAQYKTVSILEEKTGYKLVNNPVPPPFLYFYTTGDIFLKAALRDAFGTRDKTDIESEIAVYASSGEVRYGSGTHPWQRARMQGKLAGCLLRVVPITRNQPGSRHTECSEAWLLRQKNQLNRYYCWA